MNKINSITTPKIKDLKEGNSDTIFTDNIINTSSGLKQTNNNNNANEETATDSDINTDKAKKDIDNDNGNKCTLKKLEDERIKLEEDVYDENKKVIFINLTTEKIQFLLKEAKMRTHYYKNAADEIFSYRYKSLTKKEPYLFHCCKKNIRCYGKIRVYDNFWLIKLVGFHDHSKGIEKFRFYKKYPFLAQETWKHIQIFEMEDRIIVVRIK